MLPVFRLSSLWLANCYFSNHRACNIVHILWPGWRGLHRWSLILKAFATDSIFGRDSYSKVLSETLETSSELQPRF